jgi:hypothetical protein
MNLYFILLSEIAVGDWLRAAGKSAKAEKKAGAECICLFAIEFGIGNWIHTTFR